MCHILKRANTMDWPTFRDALSSDFFLYSTLYNVLRRHFKLEIDLCTRLPVNRVNILFYTTKIMKMPNLLI